MPSPPSQPDFDFTIEAPTRSSVPTSVQQLRFVLHGITIEGAKTLPPEQFRPLYARLIDKEITVSDILDVADAIEDRYRQAGYVLSHAYVPAQRVKNGVFTIDVVEGYVASVSVEGGSPSTQQLIRSYLAPVVAKRPLDLATIERALLLANDLPGVTAAGVLRPSSTEPGASELAVTLTETPYSGGLAVDNRGSNFSGVWTLAGDAEANHLFTVGDQLGVNYATSPDALEKTAGQVHYRRPFGSNGAVGSFNVTVTHGEPGSSLQPFDLVTDSYAFGPRLSYPLLRSRAESLQLDGGLTIQDARVRANPPVPTSHDKWRVADLGLTYSRVGLGGNWSGNIDVAEGLGLLGATTDGSPNLSHPGAATEYTKVTGTIRHVRELIGPISVAISGQAQYAFAPLVAGEQIAFGGSQIGRGYDPGAITGDDGAGGSIELRVDQHVPQYALETIEPYIYYEVAKAWDFRPSQFSGVGNALASEGIGVRASFPYNITGDVELSRTVQAVPGSDNGRLAKKILMDASVRF